jgi:hypothetical protein
MAVTSPSPDDPSHLHIGRDLATTIQFPHGTSGESAGGGIFPDTIEVPPKQIAVQTQSVSVGVTYIRIKLVGSHVPRYHHALGILAVHVLENPIGDGG